MPRSVGLARTGIVQGSTVRPGVADDVDLMARRNACPARAERRGHPVGPTAHGAAPRQPPGRSRSSSSRADRLSPRPVALAAGRHVVGRAAGAAVRLLDERAELHHGVLDIDGTGGALHAAHRADPVRRRRAGGSAHAERRTFALGASRISVRPVGGAAATAAATLQPTRRTRGGARCTGRPVTIRVGCRRRSTCRSATVVRRPRGRPACWRWWRRCSPASWSPSCSATRCTSCSPVSEGWWRWRPASSARRRIAGATVVVRPSAVRRWSGSSSALEDRRRARAAFERETTPTIGDALEALAARDARRRRERRPGVGGHVWSRRSGHRDAFAVTIGWGERVLDLGVSAGVAAPGVRAGADEGRPPRPRAGGGRPRSRRGDRRRRRARRRGRSVAGRAAGDVVRAGRLAPRRRRRRPGGLGLGRVASPCVRRGSAVGARRRRRRRARRRAHPPRRHVDRPRRGGDRSPRPDGHPQQPAPTLPRRRHVGGHAHRRRRRRGRAGGLRQRAGRRVAVHRAMVPRRRGRHRHVGGGRGGHHGDDRRRPPPAASPRCTTRRTPPPAATCRRR